MSTLSTTNIKHPSSSTNNIQLDSIGRSINYQGGTSTPNSTLFGGGWSVASVGGEPKFHLQSNVNTSGSNTASETARGGIGFTYFSGSSPTDLCLGIDGTPSVASNVRFYNQTEQMRLDSSGNLKFNSGYGSVATAYGCRAWVNFNGTSTVAIRASGNVSSITDHGTGEYTVNFTTAMPDADYCATASASGSATNSALTEFGDRVITTSSIKIATRNFSGSRIDPFEVYVAIFR